MVTKPYDVSDAVTYHIDWIVRGAFDPKGK